MSLQYTSGFVLFNTVLIILWLLMQLLLIQAAEKMVAGSAMIPLCSCMTSGIFTAIALQVMYNKNQFYQCFMVHFKSNMCVRFFIVGTVVYTKLFL